MTKRLSAITVLLIMALASALAQSDEAAPLTPEDDWLAAILAGGTVHLAAGEFLADQMIELTQSVQIIGAGRENTVLILDSDGGFYGDQLVVTGAGDAGTDVSLAGLTVLHGRSVSSNLIVVLGSSHLNLYDVRVGMALDDPESGTVLGVGLLVSGEANATVSDTEFYGNSQGLLVTGEGLVTVSDSMFSGNAQHGIHALHANLTVTRSHFESNGIGIRIFGDTSFELQDNQFSGQLVQDVLED